MENSKKPWKSITIDASSIGAIVSFVAMIASAFGIVNITEEEQALIAKNGVVLATTITTLATSLISIYGRVTATTKIG